MAQEVLRSTLAALQRAREARKAVTRAWHELQADGITEQAANA